MTKQWQPALDSGRIEWDAGSIPILQTFYHNEMLDGTWRGLTVLFSPSTLGYDPIAWWAGFEFVIHLAPLYAIWTLESHRRANRRSPAGFPTIFTCLGQVLGTGVIVPVFYFLCFVFGSPISRLSRIDSGSKATGLWRIQPAPFVMPLIMTFHVVGVSAAFLAPLPETRHFWTWTWPVLPLVVGLGDEILTRLFCSPASFSSEGP